MSQHGHADSSDFCRGWILSLLVLVIARWVCACCKVGVCTLQGGHEQKWELQLTNVLVHVLIVEGA